MKNIIRVGVDLAKNVFHIHAVNQNEETVWQGKYNRTNWLMAVVKRVPTTAVIGMEACGSANYWASELTSLGYNVKLIAAQFVKPYVKTNKNDKVDAEAICEAINRPNMRFVHIKTVTQQDSQSKHRVREDLVAQRTAKANQIRGLVSEYGIVAPVGIAYLRKAIPIWLEEYDNGLSTDFRGLLRMLWEDLIHLDERIEILTAQILPINTSLVPLDANTVPAAQPNFIAKSGVIGNSPTFQRTPSVPKYLRDIN